MRSTYFHLRRISTIRKHLSDDACASAINATVTSRLDYHNGLLLGLPHKSTQRLQLLQNNAACLLTGVSRREHVTPVLKNLHWLPVDNRITFKVLATIHKSLHSTNGPSYIKELFQLYHPRRSLRSSSDMWQLETIKTSNKYGARSFPLLGAKLWNSLPLELRSMSSHFAFKKNLKTELFRRAYIL